MFPPSESQRRNHLWEFAGPETLLLVERLEKVTGATITELAVLAKDWPEA